MFQALLHINILKTFVSNFLHDFYAIIFRLFFAISAPGFFPYVKMIEGYGLLIHWRRQAYDMDIKVVP